MEAGELLSRTLVYPANEVNDLLARIRAAVEAERRAMFLHVTGRGKDAPALLEESILACEALDALLTDGGA